MTRTVLPEVLGLQRLGFIGHEKALRKIQETTQKAQHNQRSSSVVLLLGAGGIGKTHLLNHLQILSGEADAQWRTSQIIDLDNPALATPWGLSTALAAAVAHTETWEAISDRNLIIRGREVQQLLLGGKLEALEKAWMAWEKALRAYLERQVKQEERPLLILVDTVEWLRSALESNEHAGSSTSHPWGWDIGRWLLQRIISPLQDRPIVWVLAGRPAPGAKEDTLKQALRQYLGGATQSITLASLSPRHTAEYFWSLSAAIRAQDPRGAQRLRDYLQRIGVAAPTHIIEEKAVQKHPLYHSTGGYPLYLAIAADAIRLGFALPEAFYNSEPLLSRPSEIIQGPVQQILGRLFARRTPLGFLLLQMARARLGVSESLLSKWYQNAGGTQADFQTILYNLKNLSIVKYFPRPTRPYLLHDEIYRLINTLWPPTENERRQAAREIVQEYENERRGLEKRLEDEPEAAGAQKRQRLLTEEIYYRLWENPWAGYPYYLAHANAWAAEAPVAALGLQRQTLRLRWWMTKMEGREDTRGFWSFWDIEHRYHHALLYIVHYRDQESAGNMLSEQEARLGAYAGPGKPFLQVLHYLTQAHDAFYKKDLQAYAEALKRAGQQLGSESLLPQEARAALDYANGLYHNYMGMCIRRQGRFQSARRHFMQALRLMEGQPVAGILINLAYLETLAALYRTARHHLSRARRYAAWLGDVNIEIRHWAVLALLNSLDEHPEQTEQAVEQVLQRCAQRPNPRFQALALIYYAQAQRTRWNNHILVQRGRSALQEGLQNFLLPALRRLLPWSQAQKGLPASLQSSAKSLWERPYWGSQKETAWELHNLLQGDEEIELYREIGRLFREIAWAIREQGRLAGSVAEKEGYPARQAAEIYAWQAATGQTTPKAVGWWEEKDEAKQVDQWIRAQAKRAGGSLFPPLSAMVDLAWHYHYQQRLSTAQDRGFGQWLLGRFPKEYLATLENWPPKAEGSSDVDIRLWGLLGKVHMLLAHTYLREIRTKETSAEKEATIRGALRYIALSLEYNHLIGGDSNSMRRAEANLSDWLNNHDAEKINGDTILGAFLQSFRSAWGKRLAPRLYKFLDERFGLDVPAKWQDM